MMRENVIQCDKYAESTLQFCEGEQSLSQLTGWTMIPSSGILSQTAEEASHSTCLLSWYSNMMVLSLILNKKGFHQKVEPPK